MPAIDCLVEVAVMFTARERSERVQDLRFLHTGSGTVQHGTSRHGAVRRHASQKSGAVPANRHTVRHLLPCRAGSSVKEPRGTFRRSVMCR